MLNWKDSHLDLYPYTSDFSHYYTCGHINGASRIDRQYVWGLISASRSFYVPLAFSDHYGLIIDLNVSSSPTRSGFIKGSKNFKIRNEVARDQIFQEKVNSGMQQWKLIQNNGLDILTWWELVVKPGIRRIAMERSNELNKEHRGALNILLIRQAFVTKKLRSDLNSISLLAELKQIQTQICDWYDRQSKKIQDQSRIDEFLSTENTRVYHHELHKQSIKRSSIVKLETELGMIEGHESCATYLESKVHELLDTPADLDQSALY